MPRRDLKGDGVDRNEKELQRKGLSRKEKSSLNNSVLWGGRTTVATSAPGAKA